MSTAKRPSPPRKATAKADPKAPAAVAEKVAQTAAVVVPPTPEPAPVPAVVAEVEGSVAPDAPSDTVEDATPAPEADAGAAPLDPASVVLAPSVAPLEPPAPKPVDVERKPYISVADSGVALLEQADLPTVFDDATGQAPQAEGLFVPLTENGSAYVCTRRLIERVSSSRGGAPIERLLIPAGMQVSDDQVAIVLRLLAAQTPAPAETVENAGETPTG